jgi:hypothetical protein
VSAWKLCLTPLAVLVPSLATVVGAALVYEFWHLPALVVIVPGLGVTWLCGRRYSPGLVFGAAVLTLGAGSLAWGLLGFAELVSILGCTNGISRGWMWLAVACGSLVYLVVGTVSFRTKHPLLGVLLALILGVTTMFVVVAGAPTTQIDGCES